MKIKTIGYALVLGLLSGWFAGEAVALPMPSSGLKLWLKADAITTLNDGDPVDSWTDSSGNNNHASNTGVMRPAWRSNVVNGMPAVRFDGNTNFLQNTSYTHGANDAALFVVAKRNGDPRAGYHTIFIGGATSFTAAGSFFYQLYAPSATTALTVNFPGTTLDVNSTVNFTNAVFEVMSIVKNNAGAGTSQFWVDGISAGSGTGTQVLNPKYWIGNWNMNNPLNGDIAEIVLYNTALSDADRQLVEGILAWKYGLAGDLPPTHAWKYTDPTRGQPAITNSTASYNRAATSAALSGYLYSTGFYPTTVSVYWGAADGGAPTSGVWQYTNTIVGVWDQGSYPSANVTLPASNTTYFYRFAATNEGGVSWAPITSSFFADARPVISNAIPSSIRSLSATLNGYLAYTSAFPVTVSVYWGTVDGGAPTSGVWQYTNTFAVGQWDEGSTPSTNVTLPTPNVTYYYRYYCTGAGGVAWAPSSASFYASDEIFWIQSASGTHDWTNSANWLPAIVPNQVEARVIITNDRAGSQIINLNQTNTIGSLMLGNANSITLTNAGGGAFRFDNGSHNPSIENPDSGVTHVIAANVTYGSGSGLEVTNAGGVWITGALGGFSNLVKSGAGLLSIYGNNTFNGTLVIKGGMVTDGNGTPAAGNIIPNTAWIQLENNAEFKIQKNNEAFLGARGTGAVYVSNSGRIVIGTNIVDSTTYTTRLVAGGSVSPGFGSAVGDLFLNYVSAGHAEIKGGDIYIDVAGATRYDRIVLRYSANKVLGGNLHLNFIPPYYPAHGASFDVVVTGSGGSVTNDTNPAIFDHIDSNLDTIYTFTAALVSTTTVRVTATLRPVGAVYLIR